jgi:hypothetical protein
MLYQVPKLEAFEQQRHALAVRQRLVWCGECVGGREPEQPEDAEPLGTLPPEGVPGAARGGRGGGDSLTEQLPIDVMLRVAAHLPPLVPWAVRRRAVAQKFAASPWAVGSAISLCYSAAASHSAVIPLRIEAAMRRLACAKLLKEALCDTLDTAVIAEMTERLCATAAHGEVRRGQVNAWSDPMDFS